MALWINFRLLLLESHLSNNGHFNVGKITKLPPCEIYGHNQIVDLKKWIADWNRPFQGSFKDYRLYPNHLTTTQLQWTNQLTDEMRLKSLDVTDLTLIIDSRNGKIGQQTDAFLWMKLPHVGSARRRELSKRLQSMSSSQIDRDSICEKPVNSATYNEEVSILNYTANTFVPHIIISGEEYIPHTVNPNTKMVEFRSKYSYQYTAASDEYIEEVKQAHAKYESDMAHCNKLLRDLPIALANSQTKLSEEIKSIRENESGTELSELGALVLEQSVISDEIKVQQKRLSRLKPIKLDPSKFTSHDFQSEIHLSFGWHKFGSTTYELTHTPVPPIELKINSLPESKQRPVSIKRSRQEFELVVATESPTSPTNPRVYCRYKSYLSTDAAIRKQVEYYFSDSNFPTDKYLKEIYDSHDGWVPLAEIASFRKIRALTSDLTTIVHALTSSTLLQLNQDQTKVTPATTVQELQTDEVD